MDRRRFVGQGAAVAAAAWTIPAARTIRLGEAQGSPPPQSTTTHSSSSTTSTPRPDALVTGGGFVADHQRFGFNARDGSEGPSGELTFVFGTGPPTLVKSVAITGVAVDGDRATIVGTATVDETDGYTFRVDVVDGNPDRFAIVVLNNDGSTYHQAGTPASPLTVQGSIQIH